nr:MAG TPA_asm: hypothetical protein [Caudoviricetes sp.]
MQQNQDKTLRRFFDHIIHRVKMFPIAIKGNLK